MSSLFFARLKRALLGRPIATSNAAQEKHGRLTGLAIFSADALSSVAYATEEILRTLVLVAGASSLVVPIGVVIALLLLVVVFSYRQTIFAYPGGGGAYVVAKENLGLPAGLVAAGALLTDYVLTVAVSICAGVAAITSAAPALAPWRVELAVGCLGVQTLANLRGVRESGRVFAVPTFCFIVAILVLVAVGAWQVVTGGAAAPVVAPAAIAPAGGLTLFLLLRAFANGCTAMTGVEAVANGVPEFRDPPVKYAAATLSLLGGLAVVLFLGITMLAARFAIVPSEQETVVSQLARAVFGGRGILYWCVQGSTATILLLAANTAFAGFPRLASILARDHFLPHQFMHQGDRLAFSNGILALSALAAILIVAFGGDTHALLPLYMVGVFVAFTLSQFGMAVRSRALTSRARLPQLLLSVTGGTLTAIVLGVVATAKFFAGAWISLTLIPLLVGLFHAVRRHYLAFARDISLEGWQPPPRRGNTILIPVNGVQRAVVEALHYARSLGDDVRAVLVDVDPAATAAVQRDWPRWGDGVPLVVLPSPYRSVLQPLLAYIDAVDAERPEDYVTVVLPEVVPRRWWQFMLHNQRSLLLKAALLFRPTVILTSVPFHLAR